MSLFRRRLHRIVPQRGWEIWPHKTGSRRSPPSTLRRRRQSRRGLGCPGPPEGERPRSREDLPIELHIYRYVQKYRAFCSRHGNDSADEVVLFYLIAMEFVRYVEAQHGRDVGAGGAIWDAGSVGVFESRLRARLGGTCGELYGQRIEIW